MRSRRTFAILLLAMLFVSCLGIAENKPRISIITSVWKGDEFIEGFLADITRQTIFPQSELILIDANSPGNEEPVIKNYMEKFANIKYVKLSQDPGLYAVWNLAIKMASADLIVNANLDDRSKRDALEIHVRELEANSDIDLAYTGYYTTGIVNDTFENIHFRWVACPREFLLTNILKGKLGPRPPTWRFPCSDRKLIDPQEFSVKNMCKCLPGPRPVWRKSLHDRFGFFDESYAIAGDFEMWQRAVEGGAVFKKIPGNTTLYYHNPQGLSTSKSILKSSKLKRENALIVRRYGYLWGW